MGGILSLALFPILGICLLLLDNKLYDRRLWRRRPAADVADSGPGGKYHGRAHVRVVGQCAVHDSASARRAHGTPLDRPRESGCEAHRQADE